MLSCWQRYSILQRALRAASRAASTSPKAVDMGAPVAQKLDPFRSVVRSGMAWWAPQNDPLRDRAR